MCCVLCVLVAVCCVVPVCCAVTVRGGCCCGRVVVVGARGGAGVVVGSSLLPREVVGEVATAGDTADANSWMPRCRCPRCLDLAAAVVASAAREVPC